MTSGGQMTYRSMNRDLLSNFKTPNLKQFRLDKKGIQSNQIFRIEKEDLIEFFNPA